MRLFSDCKDRKAGLKVVSGFSINLAAVWFGAAFISPNFGEISDPNAVWLLTGDIFLGIFYKGVITVEFNILNDFPDLLFYPLFSDKAPVIYLFHLFT